MANNKGFTIVEIVIVITIIGILFALTVPHLSRTVNNTKVDTVEATLREFSMDMNNYIIDYGIIDINVPANDITEYKKQTWDFIKSINSNYSSFMFDCGTDPLTDNHITYGKPGGDGLPKYFEVKTLYKTDPWNNKYTLVVNTYRTVSGSKIVKDKWYGVMMFISPGPDGKLNTANYGNAGTIQDKYGDDILIIIQPK